MRKERNRKEKQKRDMWRSQGLCTKCGKPRVMGYTLCVKCLQRNEKYNRKKNPIPRSERKEYGLCYICGVEVEQEGNSLCVTCRDRASKNMKDLLKNPTPAMVEARENYKKYNKSFYKHKRENTTHARVE